MKKLSFLFVLCIAYTSIAQTKNFIDQPYLETTAKIDTLVQPDEVYIKIIIKEKDSKGKISVEEQERKMIKSLKSIGINTQKQLTLSDVSSNFKKYFLKRKDILKTKAYELKVFNTQTAGLSIVKLEQIGIANVSLSKMEYSKIEDLKLILKSKAIAKAKKQANYLLAPLNQKIIRAIHISDRFSNNNYRRYGAAMEMTVSKTNSQYTPPAIEFKPIKIESEVSVKFAIQ